MVQSTITTNRLDSVYASGYRAIAGNESSIDSRSTVNCFAAFGCYSTLFIKATDKIVCQGSNSCAASLIDQKGSRIDCSGSNSCQGSILRTTGNYVYCDADSSCSYTNIIITNTTSITIDGYGAYSLMASSIETPDYNAIITVNLYGYKSGYGLNITCKPSDICNINRFSNSGKPTDIKCNGNCNIMNISDLTFIGFNELSFDDILLYDSKSLTTNYDNICNQHPNANLADNYTEYARLAIDIINEGPICCRGYRSCYGVNSIGIYSTNQDSIICSGYYACYGVDTIHNSNGAVICSGRRSCMKSNIGTTGTVYCLGVRSCLNSNIYNATNIVCSGWTSCKDATIISDVDTNIYLLSHLAGPNMAIYCQNNCRIFCKGFKACKGLTVNGHSYTASPTTEPSSAPTYPTTDPTSIPTSEMKRPSFTLTIILITLGIILIICVLKSFWKIHQIGKVIQEDPQSEESENTDVEIAEINSIGLNEQDSLNIEDHAYESNLSQIEGQ